LGAATQLKIHPNFNQLILNEFLRTYGANMSQLADIFEKRVTGDILFDLFSRGRYAMNASLCQMTPLKRPTQNLNREGFP